MIRPRAACTASLILALCLGPGACTRDEQPAPKQAATAAASSEQQPESRLRAPRANLPEPAPAATSIPLLVAGRVVRPDGSPLERVQVALWANDASGQLAEVLAHTETGTDGKFELPTADIARVSRLRFRWQALRQPFEAYHVVPPAVPFGPPVDTWLDRAEISDWTAITATVDTGWTATGLVRSESGRLLTDVRVKNTANLHLTSLDWHARFAFIDLPWALEAFTLEVTDHGQPDVSIEVVRPEPGSRETFTEITVP